MLQRKRRVLVAVACAFLWALEEVPVGDDVEGDDVGRALEEVPLGDDVERTKMSLWLTMLSGPRRCPSG